ncbi:MAG: acetoin utilization protein AcuC, partial [Promethearchaeota archaeon]
MVQSVGLIYTDAYQKYNFGPDHPLRPLRLKLTYELMKDLGFFDHPSLKIIEPRMATKEEIERVHSKDYVDAVKKLSDNPNNR